MKTMRFFLALALLGAIWLPSHGQATPGAVDVVQEYIALWKTGSVSIAVDRHWSVTTTLSKSYGDDYLSLSPGEKAYVEKLMNFQLILPNTFPEVTSLIADAKFENLMVKSQTDAECEVAFDIIRSDADPIRNVMKLVLVDGEWKIYDVANGGKPFLGESLRNMWADVKGRATLPIVFDVLLNQAISQKIKQYK